MAFPIAGGKPGNPIIFSNKIPASDSIDYEAIMQCARADSVRTPPHRTPAHRKLAAKFRISRNAMALAKAAMYHLPGETAYPGCRLPLESRPDSEALIVPLTGTLRVRQHECVAPPLTATGVYVAPTDGSPASVVGTGIVQPDDWEELPGIVVVTQNPLDALALWTIGVCAVAIPDVATGLPILLRVIRGYGRDWVEGYTRDVKYGLEDRGWFWANHSDLSWASWNAHEMKAKGIDFTWWTTCPVGDWVRARIPSVTNEHGLVELGNTLAAVIEDNSADSGYLPESAEPIVSPPKCDTLPPEAIDALVPESEYRRHLSSTARARHDLSPTERLAAEEAARAADSGDIAEYRQWVQVGSWATQAAEEYFRSIDYKRSSSCVTNAKESLPYFVVENKICHRHVEDDGTAKDTVYSNFAAIITGEIVCDDGTETTTEFEVRGVLFDGTPLEPILVPAGEFDDLKWITAMWGVRPNIYAVRSSKDHMRVAIRYLSGRVPRRTVYKHTGWREIGGRWVYLTAGGAIGSAGVVPDITVDLGRSSLENYQLPQPPEFSKQAGYVRASLGLLDGLAPDRVVYPLYAAIACAVLGENQTVVALNGLTGSYKSQIAALIQQHWGSAMIDRKLPGSWKATANFLELLGHHAKDAVLVVDDFLAGNGPEASRMHEKAETFLRGVGNGSSRGRLNADATAKPSKPSRCLVITTGECSPRGGSLQARMMQLDVVKKSVNRKRLTICQQDAASGEYANAMAAFLQWVAPQYRTLKEWFISEVLVQRDLSTKSGQHARTGTQVATLMTGLMCFLEFAQCCGAITPDEVKSHLERAETAMADAAVLQTDDQMSEDPSGKFMRLLAASIASGRSHLASVDGTEPRGENGVRWGWRNGQPLGDLIGWTDGINLYLEPESSYAAACNLAKAQNDGFQIGRRDLNKRLETAGYLVRVDKRQLTVRMILGGSRRNVLHTRVDSLIGEKSGVAEASDLFESL